MKKLWTLIKDWADTALNFLYNINEDERVQAAQTICVVLLLVYVLFAG